MTSLAPASPPTRICASSRAAAFFAPRTSTITRHGWARLASMASSMASSVLVLSSVTTTNVSTRPCAITPLCSRSSTNLRFSCWVEVAGMSTIMSVSSSNDQWVRTASWSRPAPGARGAGHDGVRPGGAPAAGRVGLRRAGLGPPLQHRVQDLPGPLHLGIHREQRRFAEQHIQDEPLVRLWRILGEGQPIAEVHVDVAHLHGAAGHLGAEPHGHTLVRLHPDDQRVLTELL